MIIKLFMEYSYKEYQLEKQKINKIKMAKNYENNFLANKETYLYKKNDEILGLASLKKFDALSKICKKNLYFLKDLVVQKNQKKTYQELIKKVLKKYNNHFDFLITRQPVDNYHAINALIKNNFYYVCSEAIYTLNLAKKKLSNHSSNFKLIRKMKKNDLPLLKKIASNNHNFKRYLFDSFFKHDQIKDLYNQVIENSYFQKNHCVYVYEKKKVRGFISFILNKKLSEIMNVNYASLDYITVDNKHQKEGIGNLLSNFALDKLRKNFNTEVVSVKTMANNYQAINLLNKIGFSKTSESLILHHRNNK